MCRRLIERSYIRWVSPVFFLYEIFIANAYLQKNQQLLPSNIIKNYYYILQSMDRYTVPYVLVSISFAMNR